MKNYSNIHDNLHDNLHEKARRIYFDKSVRENMPVLWKFVEFATQAWLESGGKQTLEEYLLEHGCPEYDIVSKRVFQLCIYHDSNWALENLDYQDLKEWSEEHLLDVHTMLELRNYFVQK